MAAKKQSPKKTKVIKAEVVQLSQEQQTIIDETVKFVNEKWLSSCSSIVEIGEYLLKYFYNDDPDLIKSRGRKKGIALRHLTIRPELHMTYSTLSRALNIALQEKKCLHAVNSTFLTSSHKIQLLHIEDEKEKLKYAQKIIDEKMSCRDFIKLLVKDGFIGQRGLPSGERKKLASKGKDLLDPFWQPLDTITELSFDDFNFDAIPKSQSKSFLDAVTKAKAKIDKLFELISKSAS